MRRREKTELMAWTVSSTSVGGLLGLRELANFEPTEAKYWFPIFVTVFGVAVLSSPQNSSKEKGRLPAGLPATLMNTFQNFLESARGFIYFIFVVHTFEPFNYWLKSTPIPVEYISQIYFKRLFLYFRYNLSFKRISLNPSQV